MKETCSHYNNFLSLIFEKPYQELHFSKFHIQHFINVVT